MDVGEVGGYIADFGFAVKGGKGMIRHTVHDFYSVKEAEACMTVILRPFITAAVVSVFGKEKISAFGRFLKNGPPDFFILFPQSCCHKHILGTPDSPVVHRAYPIAHPPEMLL